MPTNLSPEILKEVEARIGTSDFSKTQFNVQLPSGEVIPAGVNPSQAATIIVGGGILDLKSQAGSAIAKSFAEKAAVTQAPTTPSTPAITPFQGPTPPTVSATAPVPGGLTQQQLQLQPGETTQQYTQRIAALRAAQTPAAPAAPTIAGVSDLFNNQQISALETKIARMSADIAAGIATGGATKILGELFEEFGIAEEQSLVNSYNAQILDIQKRLREIPDDLKETLQDVGVTEAQLNRLILKESQEPMEVLRDLMEQKGAAQDRINQSLKFVGLFSDAALADQAAKIEALKFDLETHTSLLSRLDDRQKVLATNALNERKAILKVADDARVAGASETAVNMIINAGSQESALSLFAQFAPKPQLTEEVVGGFRVLRDQAGKVIATKAVSEEDAGAGGFDRARAIIAENSSLSNDELKTRLLEETKLTVTEINSLLETRKQPPLTLDQIRQKIVDALETQKDIFSRSEAKAEAERQLKESLGIKDGNLPKSFNAAVEDALVEVYGRTLGQRFFPFGR